MKKLLILVVMIMVVLLSGCAIQKQLAFHREYTKYLKKDLNELANLWKQEKLAKEKIIEEYQSYRSSVQSLSLLIEELVMIDTVKAGEILKKHKMFINLKDGGILGYKGNGD